MTNLEMIPTSRGAMVENVINYFDRDRSTVIPNAKSLLDGDDTKGLSVLFKESDIHSPNMSNIVDLIEKNGVFTKCCKKSCKKYKE